MNTEYFEKEVIIEGQVYGFWQLEIVSSNIDKNMGFLGCAGYKTLEDLKARTGSIRQQVMVPTLTERQSYQAVREEALTMINANVRFAGSVLKQYEIVEQTP
jgi:hypothetical protein